MTGPAPTSPWSSLAASWEDLFPLRPPRLALAEALAPPGGRVLDAGCATGSLPRALAARGRTAHGLDLDPAFLEVARRRAEAEGVAVTWHLASLLDLGRATAGNRFRLITCLGQTLPHLLEEAEWLDFFRQAREALEPGGSLVIQAVSDAGLAPGQERALPPLACPGGRLERRRVMLSETLARFENVFHPDRGSPIASLVLHRRMAPEWAGELLRQAGLEPGPPQADEAGRPFQDDSAGWLMLAERAG